MLIWINWRRSCRTYELSFSTSNLGTLANKLSVRLNPAVPGTTSLFSLFVYSVVRHLYKIGSHRSVPKLSNRISIALAWR